jgi:primosomal replication protein N
LEANRLTLDARIAERSSIRYTPAGIPVIELTLMHASEQQEAGSTIKVECELKAVAMGELARAVEHLPVGQELRLRAFIARRSLRNAQPILHIQDIRIPNPT